MNTGSMQKQVQMTPDHVMAGFVMQLSGMISVTVQQVPPHVLARQLMLIASKLLAGIEQVEARTALAREYTEEFKLQVETNAIAMRTTPGGIVMPKGVVR